MYGVESISQCTDGNVRVVAEYLEDPALYIDAAAVPMLVAVGLDAITAGSGVLNLSITGESDNGILPCNNVGLCSVNFTLPLLSSPTSLQSLVCLKIQKTPASVSFAGYPNSTSYFVANVLPASASLSNGAATCHTSRSGAYLIGFATMTQPAAGVPEVPGTAAMAVSDITPNDTTAYTFDVTFQMDFQSLISNATVLDAFKLAARTAMAKAAGLDVKYVLLKDLKQGSVIATFDVNTPNSWTADQVNAAVTHLMSSNPASVFDASFMSTFNVSGVSVVLKTPLTSRPLISRKLALPLGIGIGVGGALTITVIVVIMIRRKRMLVEPRNGSGVDAEQGRRER
jgi:hypothetical protein